ncbi:uncharacterized [Tachysurus ichikawai]
MEEMRWLGAGDEWSLAFTELFTLIWLNHLKECGQKVEWAARYFANDQSEEGKFKLWKLIKVVWLGEEPTRLSAMLWLSNNHDLTMSRTDGIRGSSFDDPTDSVTATFPSLASAVLAR